MSIINQLIKLFLLLCFISSISFSKEIELFFNQDSVNLKPKEIKKLELWLKNSPEIYGVEISLEFDPNYIKLLNHKVTKGSFFGTQKNLVIRNEIDKQSISYVFTLINPANEVKGEGEVFNFSFQALKEGDTSIKFKTAKLGTKEGKVYIPSVSNLNIKISTFPSFIFEKWYLVLLGILFFVIVLIKIKKGKK